MTTVNQVTPRSLMTIFSPLLTHSRWQRILRTWFAKYLFNPNGVKLNGKTINIRAIDRFQDAQKDAINFMFFSTALLYNRLTEDKENSLTSQDFVDNAVVVIADEAHRLNVDTRKKLKKTEEEDIRNWETAVQASS